MGKLTLMWLVLDTCVLYPIVLCDTLLRSADAALIQARWTVAILEELHRNLEPRIGSERARRRIEHMRQAFPDALVTDYEPHIVKMTNHPKDRHVVAAAVAAHADIILTTNLDDFPDTALQPFALTAWSPDELMLALESTSSRIVQRVIAEQTTAYRNPPWNEGDVPERLALHIPQFVTKLRNDGR